MVTNFSNDLSRYHFPMKYQKLFQVLSSYFEKVKRGGKTGEKAVIPNKILNKIAKNIGLSSLRKLDLYFKELKMFNREFRQRLSQEDVLSRDNVKPIIAFFEKFIGKKDSDRYFTCVTVKKYKKRKYVSLEINALDPLEITVPLFRNSYASLHLTGTVNPSIYNALTGLNYKYKEKGPSLQLSSDSPFPSKNILALITEGISTSKEDRNPEMYRKILNYITSILKNSPGNIGIFCASYSVLNSLRMYGIIETVKNSGKKLFIERSGLSASENALLVEDFKSCGNGRGAVLLGVCGGRNSEGEDFPGSDMKTVVIIGVPYHMPTPSVNAKIEYYDKVFRGKGWLYGYLAPAMQRANQASGRPIRKLDDKGVIIFMDKRFKDKYQWISEWVRKELKTLPDNRVKLLEKIIRNFWERSL
jgi:DNA excision repair protein ERCC-2